MKWLLISFAVVVFAVGPAVADFDYVDIGDTTSESGHNLVGWGPIEPANSGGNYGGVDDCRAVYYPGEDPSESWATIDLNFGPAGKSPATCLIMSFLDGIAGTDSFDVYISDTKIGSYDDDIVQGENWILVAYDASDFSGTCTVKIVSTEIDPPWSGFDTYGQVCFDWMCVTECAPNAAEPATWGAVKALLR